MTKIAEVLARSRKTPGILHRCWLYQDRDGVLAARCGVCHRGRLKPKEGVRCRVCRARVFRVVTLPYARTFWDYPHAP